MELPEPVRLNVLFHFGTPSWISADKILPSAPFHLSGPHKKIMFFFISHLKKQGRNSFDISIHIRHSFYVFQNLCIVQSCSWKCYYSFANLRASKIACVENRLFLYLPLTFQKRRFYNKCSYKHSIAMFMFYLYTQLFFRSFSVQDCSLENLTVSSSS